MVGKPTTVRCKTAQESLQLLKVAQLLVSLLLFSIVVEIVELHECGTASCLLIS